MDAETMLTKTMHVELTPQGYLSMEADVAALFPTGTVMVWPRDGELWLMPVSYTGAGGLLLKVQNARGDRCVLVDEFLPPGMAPGVLAATWDEANGALRIPLQPSPGEPARGTRANGREGTR